MTCDCRQTDLLAHLHGELDAPGHALVDRHLATCPRCALEVDRLRAEMGLLVECLRLPVPDGLEGRIIGRLRPRRHSRAPLASHSPAVLARAVALGAASVAMALAGLRLISPHAFGLIVSTLAVWGSQASELVGHQVPAWPSLLKAFSALGLLAGL